MRRAAMLLMLAALIGCAAQPSYREAQAPSDGATAVLTVENDCYYDAAVYVVHHGMPVRRLDGYVSGNSKRTFLLYQADVAEGSLQLFAKYVGRDPVLSEPIVAAPGAFYWWQLAPECQTEFLFPKRSA